MKIETIDQLKKKQKYYIYEPSSYSYHIDFWTNNKIFHDPDWFEVFLSEIRYGSCVFFENEKNECVCIGIGKYLKLHNSDNSRCIFTTKEEMIDEWNKREEIKFHEIYYFWLSDKLKEGGK